MAHPERHDIRKLDGSERNMSMEYEDYVLLSKMSEGALKALVDKYLQ